jgi:hypothetical protein
MINRRTMSLLFMMEKSLAKGCFLGLPNILAFNRVTFEAGTESANIAIQQSRRPKVGHHSLGLFAA